MYENDLNKRLAKNPKYQGSFAADELAEIKIFPYPSIFIVNLDKRERGGNHWIAIAIYMNDFYICDSLGGLVPDNTFPSELVNFITNLSTKRTLHITQQLQPSDSKLCGHYCVAFVNEMTRHNCFDKFLALFTCNRNQNDVIVRFLNKNEI